MCKITKENDSLQRQTENKDEDSHVPPIKKNVPELRFPEFKGEYFSTKLEHISDICGGKRLPKGYSLTSTKNNHPYITISDMNKHTVLLDNIKYVPNEIVKKIEKYVIFDSDLYITVAGTIGIVGKIPSTLNGANLTENADKITNIQINQNYLLYYLNTGALKKLIEKNRTDNAQPKLALKEIRKMSIIFPSDEEQEKIADFLSAIDKKIGFMEKKHTLYKNIKKYFLDNLFPHEKMDIPNLSFKEYSNIWKQIKLKQIIYKGKAGGTPKSSIKEYYNGNIPFLSINDMTNEGKYITYTEKSITEKGLKNSSAWLVPEKSLLYSMYASVGFVSINNIPLTTSQAIFNIIFKEHVSLEFMYYYLTFYKQYLHRYIETGTQGNLNAKLIKNFKIKIPSKEEQRKIADFLSLIDTYIEINKEKLNHLKQFKKGLLQKMFC